MMPFAGVLSKEAALDRQQWHRIAIALDGLRGRLDGLVAAGDTRELPERLMPEEIARLD
jgi:hypothetical protein